MTLLSKLKRLVRKIDQRWCAPRFAKRLGPRLARDYGASKFYTAGQIRAACTKCRLPRRQFALAYAAFLPPALFERNVDVTARGDYEALRLLFFRFTTRGEDFSVTSAPHYSAGGPDQLPD